MLRPFLRTAQRLLACLIQGKNHSLLRAGLVDHFGKPTAGNHARIKAIKHTWWIARRPLETDLALWMLLIDRVPAWRPKETLAPSGIIHLRTDAMGNKTHAGIGGFLCTSGFPAGSGPPLQDMQWFTAAWSKECPRHDILAGEPRHMISALEGLALLVGIRAFVRSGTTNTTMRIAAETDSMVCALALGTWKSRSARLTFIWRELSIQCLLHDIHVDAQHISGDDNHIADALSRCTVARWLLLGPAPAGSPTGIADGFVGTRLLVSGTRLGGPLATSDGGNLTSTYTRIYIPTL